MNSEPCAHIIENDQTSAKTWSNISSDPKIRKVDKTKARHSRIPHSFALYKKHSENCEALKGCGGENQRQTLVQDLSYFVCF